MSIFSRPAAFSPTLAHSFPMELVVSSLQSYRRTRIVGGEMAAGNCIKIVPPLLVDVSSRPSPQLSRLSTVFWISIRHHLSNGLDPVRVRTAYCGLCWRQRWLGEGEQTPTKRGETIFMPIFSRRRRSLDVLPFLLDWRSPL